MTRRRALICSAVFLLALIVTAIGGATSSPSPTAVSLAAGYTQTFDTLASTGSSNALPTGWMLSEAGTSASNDGKYSTGTGSGTAGDTYSFGATGAGERALGTLLSGTLTPTIGATFTNATGGTITSLDVAYTGEEWRFGATGRADRLDFQYSLDATDLATGTWTDADALDFPTPNVATSTGALDGNATANRSAIASTISGLSIPSGQTFWIRWNDFNAAGSDDGLAVDDFSLTPHTTVVTNQPVTANCGANITTTAGTPASQQVSATDADGTVTSIALDSVSPASSAITIGNVTPASAAGGTATATLDVSSTASAGTYSVQVRATNNDATPQSGTCALTVTVNAAPVTLPIGTVQGSVPDTANGATFASPYVGQTVNVQGVVTELTREGSNNGFYLQNTDATADSDPSSSDGVFVFMGTFPDLKNGYVPVVGDEITLTGKVSEFQGMTELGSATATKVGTGSVTPFAADPPSSADDAGRYWERHEGMQAGVPTASIVDSPTHLFASTQDTEFYVLAPTTPVAQRSDPYAQRAYREAHPLDDTPGAFNGNGFRILITDEGVKVADHSAKLTPVHTFQRLAAPVAGGVFYAFGKYSVSASAQPQVVEGADPSQNDPPPAVDRSQAYSIANFNMQNLYDYRDDPFDGCDFFGNSGCTGVSPPFDYPPASDAEYQQREGEIAHQIVVDLHSPDVIAAAEAEDQDICTVQSGALVCGTTNNADGQPDVLQELALHIKAIGGPDYATAFDRNGADARGIICAFMYRTDRVSLLPADASDAVLGSSPTVVYRGAAASYNTDVSNPKALNATLPADVDRSTGVDGSNVYTRAVQFGHFRIRSTTAAGTPSDVWIAANHFTSGPDTSVGQRREQAAYSAAVVKAIQGEEPDAKIMVAGDLNDFPRPDDPFLPGTSSDQLAPLYDAGLHNLYDTVIAANPAAAYSYVFDGQAQDLDHQFVSEALFADLQGANEAHINSDWSGVVGSNRGTSDHDPMVSRWMLKNDNAPTVHAGGPYSVDEGGSVTLTASGDDPDGDSLTYAWDLDGNGTFETSGQSTVVSAADGPSSRTVTVQATDSFGLTSTDTATITVSNVAPTAVFHAPASATVGVPFTLSLTGPQDPSAADVAAGFSYAFDCGDGTGYGPFGTASSTTCRTLAVGTITVHGAIKDADGGKTEYTATVEVGVTFDSVCAIAQQFASPKVAKKICDALARAEKEAGKGNRNAEVAALADAAKEVVKAGERGDLALAEAATLLRLIAKL